MTEQDVRAAVSDLTKAFQNEPHEKMVQYLLAAILAEVAMIRIELQAGPVANTIGDAGADRFEGD